MNIYSSGCVVCTVGIVGAPIKCPSHTFIDINAQNRRTAYVAVEQSKDQRNLLSIHHCHEELRGRQELFSGMFDHNYIVIRWRTDANHRHQSDNKIRHQPVHAFMESLAVLMEPRRLKPQNHAFLTSIKLPHIFGNVSCRPKTCSSSIFRSRALRSLVVPYFQKVLYFNRACA